MCDAAPRAPAETVDGGLRAPGRSPETARVRRGVRSWSITTDGVRHATICIGPAQCGHASGSTFTALTARYQHTCGLTSAGTAYCWGYNGYGQLGDGTTTYRRHLTLGAISPSSRSRAVSGPAAGTLDPCRHCPPIPAAPACPGERRCP